MQQRPRCPYCDDALIEGECVRHGVIPPGLHVTAERPTTPESIDDLQPGSAPAEPLPPEAASDLGRERSLMDEPVITVPIDPRSPRVLWVAIALIVLAGAASLYSMNQAQDELSKKLDVLVSHVNALDQQAAADRSAADARMKAIEAKLATQVDSAAIARKVRPSVFTVVTKAGLGSGFVYQSDRVSSDLLTNFHVIASVGKGGSVQVKRAGVPSLTGTVTAIDPENDLAVVSVNRSFPALPTSTRIPQAGEPVVVVGSPLGLGGTVTSGIVSGTQEGLLQFSAPLSPGNSGGPVVDRSGQVIGVSVLKIVAFGAEGLSFAVPIAKACDLLIPC